MTDVQTMARQVAAGPGGQGGYIHGVDFIRAAVEVARAYLALREAVDETATTLDACAVKCDAGAANNPYVQGKQFAYRTSHATLREMTDEPFPTEADGGT